MFLSTSTQFISAIALVSAQALAQQVPIANPGVIGQQPGVLPGTIFTGNGMTTPIINQDLVGLMTSICTGAQGSPICEMYQQCTTLNSCDPLPYANALCRSQGMNNFISNNNMANVEQTLTRSCPSILARCSADPTICQNVQWVNSIPTGLEVSRQINSICMNNPQISHCNQCPITRDVNTNMISNCPVLKVYSALCTQNPSLSQCNSWRIMCQNLQNRSPFCNPSIAPTAGFRNGDLMMTAGLGLTLAAAATVGSLTL